MDTHAGDRHTSTAVHRARFPDARVGSYSALVNAEHGKTLIDVITSPAVGGFLAFYSATK